MFRKVLVANRGEIALRIIRALRELGIGSVAVYSAADADALHVKFADQAVCIGPAAARQSYLNVPSIISAAEITRAEAIHPGYGFLAEDADFAEMCARCGIEWIGPTPAAMRLMGDKVEARRLMRAAGVPVLPGTDVLSDPDQLVTAAEQVGLPVILKAAAGGGGRGMKIVRERERLVRDWQVARAEAEAAFGNPDMYLERYCERPRHIEIQVAADRHGRSVHLGERECSIQRRHQKMVEESPAVGLPDEVRDRLARAALAAVDSIGYVNLGTVEFLLEPSGAFYFMEMNTRLQVEHPITEAVIGLDLVREQIRIAAGEALSVREPRRPRGHAIELRINAEDPDTFAPCPGRISGLNIPGGPGVRVDTHIYEGYVVPPHYDSLLAKLIVHDDCRESALRRARRCVSEFVVEGVKSNLSFHRRLLADPDFCAARLDTGLVGRMLAPDSP
jgi:acetyl-CoA carboxylase biotin carboxylase subunit